MLRQKWMQLLLAYLFPLLSASSSPSNYSAPRPAGFACRVDYTDTPIDNFGAYMAAMAALVEWSGLFEWDTALPKSKAAVLQHFSLSASFASTQSSHTPLKLSHVAFCLQEGIAHMSAHGRYQEFVVRVYIDRYNVGTVTMRAVDTAPSHAEHDANPSRISNITSSALDQVLNDTSMGANSGRLPDPTTPALELLWHFPGGSQYIWSDVLDTILDAMVYVASEPQVMRHDQIYGHGITPLLQLSVEKRVPLWTQTSVQKGLYLLAAAYYRSKRWQPMDFKLTWRLKVFADGYLWQKLGPGALGTASSQQ
ncbi:MAG: hypothetical protein Q9182_005547 [Xanthomendoza sp. 2 TL-2023]